MLEFLERLDAVISRLWVPIVSLLCRITRMSNFTIARGALVAAGLLLVTDQAVTILDQNPKFMQLIFLFIWIVVGSPTFMRAIRKLERGEEVASSAFSLDAEEWFVLVIFRSTFTLFAVVFLIPPATGPLHASFDLMVSLCGYATTNTHGKRPSRIKHAMKQLKGWRPQIKVRTPIPAPS